MRELCIVYLTYLYLSIVTYFIISYVLEKGRLLSALRLIRPAAKDVHNLSITKVSQVMSLTLLPSRRLRNTLSLIFTRVCNQVSLP